MGLGGKRAAKFYLALCLPLLSLPPFLILFFLYGSSRSHHLPWGVLRSDRVKCFGFVVLGGGGPLLGSLGGTVLRYSSPSNGFEPRLAPCRVEPFLIAVAPPLGNGRSASHFRFFSADAYGDSLPRDSIRSTLTSSSLRSRELRCWRLCSTALVGEFGV